jgi:dTMP kinase
MKKNLFIALEGIDGCGKSTQQTLLAQKLREHGLMIYETCEPTESRIGQLIRDVFNHRMEADHRTIAGLFVADRLDHILNQKNGILRKMSEGYTVITDRYYFSSYAYQGAHMSLDWVIQANSQSAELLRPDINIYIDIDPEISMQRIAKSRNSIELFETKENLHRVRETYFRSFAHEKHLERIEIVNGDQPVELIANEIWGIVDSLITH